MSRILYPKPVAKKAKKLVKRPDVSKLPYHVLYSEGDVDLMWKHYNSELMVKLASWYHCRLLGFTRRAELFTREEYRNVVLKKIES